MTNKGIKKPSISFIGNSSIEVTGSMYLIKFQKYCILLDCGLVQGHDIATDYKRNMEMLNKIKPREIDWIIVEQCHIDHSGLVPALYARGCQAHLIVPSGSREFLKLLWLDSMKIMQQDCMKLQRNGMKASPFYNEADIDKAYLRSVEVDKELILTKHMTMRFYNANHIIHARQVYLEMEDGYKKYRIGFTGDIGGNRPQPYVESFEPLPFVDCLIAENTYNEPSRPNKPYDRDKDLMKIQTAIKQYHRVAFPIFSLGRCQTIMTDLYDLWKDGSIPHDTKVVVDSPLAIKFCNLYPNTDRWNSVLNWSNVQYVQSWEETQALQHSNQPFVLLSASGFMQGGKIREWLKYLLPDKNACICFCGFSGDNGTAYEIRHGDREIDIDGEKVANNCNLIELVSYSSHASYEELMDYYVNQYRYLKIALVHGNFKSKVSFCEELQNRLIESGNSARVICVNENMRFHA